MGNFFGDLFGGMMGQSKIPDHTSFNAGSIASDMSALEPQVANTNLAYNQTMGPGLANVARQVENIYDPNQGALRESTTNNILSDLGLGGKLPKDVQDAVLQSGFQKAGNAGMGASQSGRNLVARDFGLTSMDIRNQRLNRATQYTRSAPQTFQPQTFINPGSLAGMDAEGIGADNQYNTQKAGMESENNANMFKSILALALAYPTGGASMMMMGGNKGMGSSMMSGMGGMGGGGGGGSMAGGWGDSGAMGGEGMMMA